MGKTDVETTHSTQFDLFEPIGLLTEKLTIKLSARRVMARETTRPTLSLAGDDAGLEDHPPPAPVRMRAGLEALYAPDRVTARMREFKGWGGKPLRPDKTRRTLRNE